MTALSLPYESFQTFGDLLKYLRRRERLTQLELSISVGYSEAQISRLEQNQRLPDLAALKAVFIPALHLENEPEPTARLLHLAQSARQEDAPVAGVPPYKGLLFFDQSDADLFFGREILTTHLVDRTTDLATDASSRFLAIVGASGSGKSSLVRAGLAVTLQRSGWDLHIFTPTTNPLKMLAANYNSTRAKGGKHHLILVDQFEETFTLCHDENERATFVERLLSIARDKSAKTTVVIALRADFYSHCAQYPLLREAVAAEQEYIGQMTNEELRRAIEEPAKHGGWEFERGLVDLLLNDIGADGTGQPEPGALPLLSHALLATWERRRGRTFTIEGYRASGGVRGAIAETAESVFNDRLNRSQKNLARGIFLRLTELGEGTEDTRRRAALNELAHQSEETVQLRTVLNLLADARLITLNEDSAEVAHEALIREWQRLHEWLSQDREGLRLHRHLTESAHEWEARGQDVAELYRGARLAQMREWALSNEEVLNASERGFITASIEHEEHEELEREAQRQRELKVAQELAETQSRTAKQLRQRAIFLAGAFVLAIALAGIAVFFGNQANRNAAEAQKNAEVAQQNAASAEQNAVSANASQKQAEAEKSIATSRELAAEAISSLETDPDLSILLALQAVNKTYTIGQPVLPEAEDALHRAVQASRLELTLSGHTDIVWKAVFSPDGKLIASGSGSKDGTAKIWDAITGKELLTIQATTEGGTGNVAFSPNGKLLATGSDDKIARIWEVSTGKELLALKGHLDAVYHVAFSPDGNRLATASNDGTVKIWDIVTGKEILTLSEEAGTTVYWVAFSPDGLKVVTANSNFPDGWGTVWSLETGQKLFTLPGSYNIARSASFSPNGAYIVTSGDNQTADIWNAQNGAKLLTLYGHRDGVSSAAFSPDSARLATSSYDRHIKIWDVATGQELFDIAGSERDLNTVAFSPDGTRIVTSSWDNTVKVWNVAPSREVLTLDNGSITSFKEGGALAYSPDGTRLATANSDLMPRIWDLKTGKLLFQLVGHTDIVTLITYSADGTRVATASRDGTAKIWDALTGKALLTLSGHKDFVTEVDFTPDGTRIATSSFDKTVKIWDASTGKNLLTLEHPDWVFSVAFSANGTTLVAAIFNNTAKIWDASTGRESLTLDDHTDVIEQVVFSPDGTRVVTASLDGTAKIWNAKTGNLLFSLSSHSAGVADVAYSKDGRFLATASFDKTAKIWDALTGRELLTLYAPNALTGIAFDPDGTKLAVAGRDGTDRIYLLQIEDLIALAKSRVTRSLTLEECQQYLHVDACPAAP
jgi:WD40 repeat protein/transcriptional regulator with XRE-family HTH domain/energy-coupling factor transporter ATP-binding protein EcfA2